MSIASCLVRNDYNVIFSFLILIILNNFYNDNTKLFTKIILHTLFILIICDLIWLIVMMPTWSHSNEKKSEFWDSLSAIHAFAIIFAFLELLIKTLTIAYLAYDFKQKNPSELSELWNLSYIASLDSSSQSIYFCVIFNLIEKTAATVTTYGQDQNLGINAGGNSDFVNPY